MADNALARGAYQNFLSRVPDTADVTGTAYDSNGPIWRALGVGSTMPLNQPKVGPLENPNAESDHTWQRAPGSPYELPKWKQNVQDVLGSPGVNEVMTAANFLVPRPGALAIPKLPEKPQGIRAYHGSPHDFDRFSLDKIGTGEGAQSYGHGLYFAENEGVARSYRDTLAPAPLKRFATRAEALAAAKGNSLALSDSADGGFHVADNTGTIIRGKPAGHMYEVNINANPEHFLDWDKPLSQQNEKVISALSRVPEGVAPNGQAETMLSAIRRNDYRMLPDQGSGRFVKVMGPEGTTILRDAGIPGISYKDAGSRGASGGTRNHVVFDENMISILRKYGLAGLMAGGVASQSDPQQ